MNDDGDFAVLGSLVSSIKNGSHQSTPLDNPGVNPAFTIRRHLLQAKEDLIQIEQMKKVSSN